MVVIALGHLHVIHHCAEDGSPNGFQAAHGLPHRALASVLRIRYEQNSVPLGSEYGGVGDQAYGGCIDENVVELFSEACEELRKAKVAQKLRRVGRYMTYRQHLKP